MSYKASASSSFLHCFVSGFLLGVRLTLELRILKQTKRMRMTTEATAIAVNTTIVTTVVNSKPKKLSVLSTVEVV